MVCCCDFSGEVPAVGCVDDVLDGYFQSAHIVPGLDFSNYSQALIDYWPQFLRSFMYAGLATILALAPMAISFSRRAESSVE